MANKLFKIETAVFTRKSDGKPFAKLIIWDITGNKRYQLKKGTFELYLELSEEQVKQLNNYTEIWERQPQPQTTETIE